MSKGASAAESDLPLEVLSVSIGSIAERIADLASGPPKPPMTYVMLAEVFEQAGSDIGVLAAAMAVLARVAD